MSRFIEQTTPPGFTIGAPKAVVCTLVCVLNVTTPLNPVLRDERGRFESELHLIREHDFKIAIIPSPQKDIDEILSMSLRLLHSVEEDQSSNDTLCLKFARFEFVVQFKHSEHFEYFEKTLKGVIEINKLLYRKLYPSSSNEECVGEYDTVIKNMRKGGRRRICFYEVPFDHLPNNLKKSMERKKKKKKKRLKSLEKILYKNNRTPSDWNDYPPPPPSSMEEIYDLSSECFTTKEDEPFVHFFELEVSKWRPIHVYNWTRHFFVAKNEEHKFVTFYDHLVRGGCYESFQHYVCQFFRGNVQSVVNDEQKTQSQCFMKFMYDDLKEANKEEGGIPSGSWKYRVRAVREEHNMIHHGLEELLKSNEFDIKRFMVLKKIISSLNGRDESARRYELNEPLSYVVGDVEIKKRHMWDVDSCVDELISLLILRKPFDVYLKERYKDFLKFEESELSPSLKDKEGRPVEWASRERDLYINDRKWQDVLNRFNKRNLLDMEIVSFEMSVKYRQNLLRKKLRVVYDEYTGDNLKDRREEVEIKIQNKMKEKEALETEIEVCGGRIEELNNKMMDLLVVEDTMDTDEETGKSMDEMMKEIERLEVSQVTSKVKIYTLEREVRILESSKTPKPPPKETLRKMKALEEEICECFPDNMKRGERNEFLSSEKRRGYIQRKVFEILQHESEMCQMHEMTVSNVICIEPRNTTDRGTIAILLRDALQRRRMTEYYSLINNVRVDYQLHGGDLVNHLVKLKDCSKDYTVMEVPLEEVIVIDQHCPFVVNSAVESTYSKIERIAEEVVRACVNSNYPSAFNSSEFVDPLVDALGGRVRLFSEVKGYVSDLTSAVRKMRDQSMENLRFLKVSKPFKKKFGKVFLEDNQDNKVVYHRRTQNECEMNWDEKSQRIFFNLHVELDTFFSECLKIDPKFVVNHPGVFQLLKGFDDAFWIRRMRKKFDKNDLTSVPFRGEDDEAECPFCITKVNLTGEDENESEEQYSKSETGLLFRELYSRVIREEEEKSSENSGKQKARKKVEDLSKKIRAEREFLGGYFSPEFERFKLVSTKPQTQKLENLLSLFVQRSDLYLDLKDFELCILDILLAKQITNHLYYCMDIVRVDIRDWGKDRTEAKLRLEKTQTDVSRRLKRIFAFVIEEFVSSLHQESPQPQELGFLSVIVERLRGFVKDFSWMELEDYKPEKDRVFVNEWSDKTITEKKMKRAVMGYIRKNLSEVLSTNFPPQDLLKKMNIDQICSSISKKYIFQPPSVYLWHYEYLQEDIKKECEEVLKDVTTPLSIISSHLEKDLKVLLSDEANSQKFFGFVDERSSSLRYGYGLEFGEFSGGGGLFARGGKKCRRLFYGTFSQNGLRHGEKCKEYSPRDGSLLFEGGFKNGKREGKGIEYALNSSTGALEQVFEGKYRNGRRNGRGESFEKGVVVRGTWRNGMLDESSVFRFECPIFKYSEVKKHLNDSQKVGKGAFGVIYKVKSSAFMKRKEQAVKVEKLVAVKILERASNSMEQHILVRMIRRGIGYCYSVRCKHILESYGIILGTGSRGEIGYVMKLCEKSIDKFIEEGEHKQIPLEEKIRILKETAIGIKALHDKYLIHRDLKWGNVLLDFDGVVKITDFDTVKEDEIQWRLKTLSQSERVGTPGFRPPEVITGKNYTFKCDVYAFGLMIYSLLFEKNFPYITRSHCSCGGKMTDIIRNDHLEKHISECNLRPLMNPDEVNEYPSFLIDLMVQCWDRSSFNRPSFDDILFMFKFQDKKKVHKISLQFPLHEGVKEQTMFLIKPFSVDKIKTWIEKKFEKPFEEGERESIEEEEEEEENEGEEEEEEKTKVLLLEHSVIGTIHSDGELIKIFEHEEFPSLRVTLNFIDESFVLDSVEKKISFEEHQKVKERVDILEREKEDIRRDRNLVVEKERSERMKLEEELKALKSEVEKLRTENEELRGILDEEVDY